jgi:catechol 2,3-dioxygenase-like lactoylglutathione lyase family enzyme
MLPPSQLKIRPHAVIITRFFGQPSALLFVVMLIRAIDHIQLAMPAGQEDTARRFYADLLEIPEVAKPPHLAKRGGVWFESGAMKIHLGVESDFRPAKKAHPGLLVADLQSLIVRLAAAGIEIVEAEPLPGFEHVYVSDPFGNRIELLQPAEE